MSWLLVITVAIIRVVYHTHVFTEHVSVPRWRARVNSHSRRWQTILKGRADIARVRYFILTSHYYALSWFRYSCVFITQSASRPIFSWHNGTKDCQYNNELSMIKQLYIAYIFVFVSKLDKKFKLNFNKSQWFLDYYYLSWLQYLKITFLNTFLIKFLFAF